MNLKTKLREFEDKYSPANYEAFQLIGSSSTNTISWRLPFSFRGRNARIRVQSVFCSGNASTVFAILRPVSGFYSNDLRTFQNDGATSASNDILSLGLYRLTADNILMKEFIVDGKLEGENLTVQVVVADAPQTGATIGDGNKIYVHMLVEYLKEEHFRTTLI